MAYFSLFYENEEQETAAKEQAQNQVYYPARQKTEKKVVFVGSKMVISEETSNAPNELPCFFQDLNLDSVFLPRYDGTLPEFLRVLLFSFPADNSTIIYRQDIYKDLENPAVFQGLSDFRNYFTEAARLSASSLQSDNLLQQSKYQLDGGGKILPGSQPFAWCPDGQCGVRCLHIPGFHSGNIFKPGGFNRLLPSGLPLETAAGKYRFYLIHGR